MKKVLIATIDFPPIYGGVANYLAGFAKNLPKDKVVVLAPLVDVADTGCPQFCEHQVSSAQYKIYRRKLISDFFFLWPKWLPLIYHLFRIIKKEKIETILVGQVLPVGTAVFFLNKILGIPYYVSCHGMDILTAQGTFRKRKLMNKIFEQARGIIANSEFTKKELIKLGVRAEKITIIYPCVSDAKPADAELLKDISEKYDLKNKKIVLTVGRLVKRKGHDKVIESLPMILEKALGVKYIIVGDGQERKNLEEKVKELNLEDTVIFTGRVENKELSAFYQLSNIFITVSRQIGNDVEGFGTVYLEANQYGKPVIAGRSGGAEEAVIDGFNGLLVDPMSKEDIAGAIIKLLTNNELAQKIGRQGKERVEKEFKWEFGAKKLEKILD